MTATELPTAAGRTVLTDYVLGLGDDALILAQRLSEWITRAPQIEEDIALGNIALDLLGQARTLLSYAAAQTSRIRISGNVLNLPLRHPAMLAKAAATLDLNGTSP